MRKTKQGVKGISIPHPIFRAAFKYYTKDEVLNKLDLYQSSPKTPKLLHDPKRYMTIDQIENFAGLTNTTFYEVLEALRGKDNTVGYGRLFRENKAIGRPDPVKAHRTGDYSEVNKWLEGA